MADHSKDIEFFSPWLAQSAPSPKGEYRMRCPVHGDRNASSSINFSKGVFRCLKPGCVGGMRVSALKKLVRDREGNVGKAEYDPFAVAGDGAAAEDGGAAGTAADNVVSMAERRAARAGKTEHDDDVQSISEALCENYHQNLMNKKDVLEAFMTKRGLTLEIIQEYKIGYESKSKRYTIPIRDEQGRLVNFRKYRIDANGGQKMSNHMGYGSPARLFPLAVLDGAENVLVVEGELDALIAIQSGFNAVSGTAGSEKWMPEWSSYFDGMVVTIIYDNDQAGRLGAHRVKQSLRKHAAVVKVIDAVAPGEREDITDYFVKHGGTARKLRKLIADTPEAFEEEPLEQPVEVSVRVVDSMNAELNGKPMRMTATITGAKGPTLSVPKEFLAHCTVDAGAKCKSCPMYQPHEGELRGEVKATDVEAISRFVERGADDRVELIRNIVGAVKCGMFKADILSTMTAEELFVTASVDSITTEADYTARRIYNIGGYDTKPNVVANLTGATWPNPKTSRNEFFCWDLEPAVTSIDSFEMTPELMNELRIFQPEQGQDPLDKMRDIAVDRALNVTSILGRERMHMAMDLVFHSPLRYVWRGVETRGWLEMVVVGDTRTGKSVTARKLAEHYRLGHVISCEGATFAGLIGGNKQIGDQWVVQWGDYTINDRRLVVLDEVSGLSQEIISLMSDVRSSGEAQLNKIEHGRTTARVRSIWISNPRPNKYLDEKKTLGIDVVQEVIGNPEDIARFDLAMSVREADVESSAINSVFHLGTPKYPQHLAQALILWVWSRSSSQVIFTEDAVQRVYEIADKMGEMYVLSPGLIQRGNAHEKVSRLAAAIAARMFSASEDGQCIVVLPEHVKAAADFLHRLYSYDNFGYYARSQRIVRNRAIARENRDRIRRWLRENARVLEFLLDRKASFRSQDMEEMAHMDRDEVQAALWVLSEAKMVTKDKSQIILEPELQDLLTKGFK